MGKNLNNANDNTKLVIFEKHQMYYYKSELTGRRLELCMVNKLDDKYSIMIGSMSCQECKFNIGYKNDGLDGYGKNYIICRKITEAIKPSETHCG